VNSKLLQILMAEKGLTTKMLAEYLGVSRATVSNMRAGRPTRLDTAMKLAKYLGCSLEEIAPKVIRRRGLTPLVRRRYAA
jgi:plasmid maintenance system antidote protein VapI